MCIWCDRRWEGIWIGPEHGEEYPSDLGDVVGVKKEVGIPLQM